MSVIRLDDFEGSQGGSINDSYGGLRGRTPFFGIHVKVVSTVQWTLLRIGHYVNLFS